MLEGKSVEELKGMIAEAQRQIESQMRATKERAFQKIADIAEEVGITAEDIAKRFSRAAKGGKKAAIVRFQDPENPKNTWAGRGRKPKWLQEKLEQGKNLDDYAV
jgi:DNA-binding protein H-NS